MKKMMKCLIALLAVTALLACSEDAKEIESVAQLNAPQYTIGYEEGQSSATMLLKTHPNAVLKSFTDKIVGYEALKQGKIDAFAFERLHGSWTSRWAIPSMSPSGFRAYRRFRNWKTV